MTVYNVYRAEYRTNKTVRIGKVVDQRRAERNDNAAEMLRLAQKLYATSSSGSRTVSYTHLTLPTNREV